MNQVVCKYGNSCKHFSICFHSNYHQSQDGCDDEGCLETIDAVCISVRKIKLDNINRKLENEKR